MVERINWPSTSCRTPTWSNSVKIALPGVTHNLYWNCVTDWWNAFLATSMFYHSQVIALVSKWTLIVKPLEKLTSCTLMAKVQRTVSCAIIAEKYYALRARLPGAGSVCSQFAGRSEHTCGINTQWAWSGIKRGPPFEQDSYTAPTTNIYIVESISIQF